MRLNKRQVLRLLTIAVILSISVSSALFTAKPAYAVDCNTYGFPAPSSGWLLGGGYIDANNVYSQVLFTPAGTETAYIRIEVYIPESVFLYSVRATWYQTPTVGATKLLITPFANSVAHLPQARYTNQSLTWMSDNLYFKGEPTNRVLVELYGGTPLQILTLDEVEICSGLLVTYTPTSTPTSPYTSTPTPTASHTLTPSITFTPSPGPSPTASITPLPSSTSRGVPTVAADTDLNNRNLFATVPAPDTCGDVFNPCGALPYAVPGFATISLPSPTALQSVTPWGTATVLPLGTGATPAPGTLSTVPATYQSAATVIANYVDNLNTLSAQPTAALVIGGTPRSIGGLTGELTTNSSTFVSYVKGIGLIAQNKVFQLLLFLVLMVVFVLLVKLIKFFIPLIMQFINFVLQVIQAFKPF